MKILFLGVRDDEKPAIETWIAEHPEHDVTVSTEVLSADTVGMLDGFEALTLQQVLPIGADLLDAVAAAGIRQISSRTAGVDMIDLEAARERGIIVTNVPAYSPNAIAEFALASTLFLTRRFPVILERNDSRDFRFAGMIGREIATMRVAIIGTGMIGRITAQLFRSLGAEIVGFDLFPNAAFEEIGTYADTLEEALTGADVVSLHVPLTADNHHLINADKLALMAPGSILVNAGRGGLVDTGALIEALNSGHLAGAALDTYENEQKYFRFDWSGKDLGDPVLEELLDRPDVLVTPHVAFYTDTAVHNLVTTGLDNAVEVVTTGTSANDVTAKLG
ncbi:MAG: D-2-hydroxyacid dehydrogenase [Dermabacter sp.]|nr:D-2-hydroxyacid dehydrogenase [Dermabacter sp.]